jgi:hypothetical protein
MGLTLERKNTASLARISPEPEEVFLSWLMSMPSGVDLAIAVDVEINRLERYRGSHPGPKRLAALFRTFRRSLRPVAGPVRLQ